MTVENRGLEAEDEDETSRAEPSVAALLKSMGQGSGLEGWAGLDDQKLGTVLAKQQEEQAKAMKREARVFHDCFIGTAEGRRVLEVFLNTTLRRTAWPVHLMRDTEMLMAFGIWREAENSFVAAIMQAIATAENHDIEQRAQL